MPESAILVRRIARALLVVLAAFQAWTFRHMVSPDGVAYLDLSDAVVSGQLGDLVNGYWSPLYAIAIGLVRLLVSWTPLGAPYWEFALIHVVNFGAFLLALGAFEWFLRELDAAATRWGNRLLANPLLVAVAYALFGAAALVMISVSGTVPDLFLAAALLAAFACVLRLDSNPGDRRTATMLGILVALGALTKSIMFPLALVIFVTLALATWRRGGGTAVLRSLGVFLLGTLPWVIAMSLSLGHPSTGETGSLNFAWYVNHQQPPNTGVMPARAAPTESLPLAGLAVISDPKGTYPLWYDPARWHRDVRPRFDLPQIRARLSTNLAYFVGLLAPLLFVAVVIGAGTEWPHLRTTLARSAVVLVPTLAAFGAYAMVYATARYIAPFLVAATLTAVAAYPADATLRRYRMVLAGALALVVIDAVSPLRGRVIITHAVALVGLAWGLWSATRGVKTTRPLRLVLATSGVAALLITLVLTGWHAVARWVPVAGGASHPDWAHAQAVIRAGVPAGSRIAVLGNAENAGWARLARYQIVGVVPPAQVAAFLALSARDRDRVMAAFRRAGATQLVTPVTR
jgi:hypothetical protein